MTLVIVLIVVAVALLVSAGLVVSTGSRRGAALEGRGAPQPGTLPSTASTISAQAEPEPSPGSKPRRLAR